MLISRHRARGTKILQCMVFPNIYRNITFKENQNHILKWTNNVPYSIKVRGRTSSILMVLLSHRFISYEDKIIFVLRLLSKEWRSSQDLVIKFWCFLSTRGKGGGGATDRGSPKTLGFIQCSPKMIRKIEQLASTDFVRDQKVGKGLLVKLFRQYSYQNKWGIICTNHGYPQHILQKSG